MRRRHAEAEASVWIRIAPMVRQPDWAIEDYLQDIQRANGKLADIAWGPVESPRSEGGREVLVLPSTWSHKTSVGAQTMWRGMFVFVEFPVYVVIGQYSAPRSYVDRLIGGFEVTWSSLTCGAATATAAPPAGRPAPAATGRTAFAVESPAYSGEMPVGWVARRTGEVVTIEGRLAPSRTK